MIRGCTNWAGSASRLHMSPVKNGLVGKHTARSVFRHLMVKQKKYLIVRMMKG